MMKNNSNYRPEEDTANDLDNLMQAVCDSPQDVNARIALSSMLLEDGKVELAWHYFEPLAKIRTLPPTGNELRDRLGPLVNSLDRLSPSNWKKSEKSHAIALNTAIKSFAQRRPRPLAKNLVGPTAIVTASLANNGAERQAVNTAVQLEHYRAQRTVVAGVKLGGPFHIVVTAPKAVELDQRLVATAHAGGVTIQQTNNMTSQPLGEVCPENESLKSLLPKLPARTLFGVQRLVAHFQREKTDIAYIWQDGTVMVAALAALIAQVPRIVITTRSMPPNLRPHIYRHEYESMYQALAVVPGVSFASNSKAVAIAYCDWIGIPVDRFNVVPNGIVPLKAKRYAKDQELWARFHNSTPDTSQTIGSVFRFAIDKRPQLWISFARDYLIKNPNTRFVIVGAGSLLQEAQQQAASFGIADRFLFVGESSNVAFWLKKMDVFVLLSRFEGLPNSLMEAQMAGVPVVSTPAGGSSETFLTDKTGFLLLDAENPSLQDICEKVEAANSLAQSNPAVGDIAKKYAVEKFSIERMIRNTVALLS